MSCNCCGGISQLCCPGVNIPLLLTGTISNTGCLDGVYQLVYQTALYNGDLRTGWFISPTPTVNCGQGPQPFNFLFGCGINTGGSTFQCNYHCGGNGFNQENLEFPTLVCSPFSLTFKLLPNLGAGSNCNFQSLAGKIVITA